jgi:hypothetical protein
MVQSDGGILREISMKILIIGPSPHMAHDPGLTVKEFIDLYSSSLDVYGCFFHHDFTKIPIENENYFKTSDGNVVECRWIDESVPNGYVVAVYELLSDSRFDQILSFGSISDIDLIRAAVETASFSGHWSHVMTVSNAIHDIKFNDSLNSVNHIFTYSKYQKEYFNRIAKVPFEKISVLERSFNFSSKSKTRGIVFGGWNNESYNIKSLFSAIDGMDINLKFLTNYYELGDFDLDHLHSQHNIHTSKDDFFVNDFSNLFIKPNYDSWDYFIDHYVIFVDVSMQQGSCRTLSRAYDSGSYCVVIDTPRHREFASVSDRYILVNSSVFFSSSGYRLYIPDHLDLYLKLSNIIQVYSKNMRNNIIKPKDINIKKDLENLYNKIISSGKEKRFFSVESIT